ncbi:unnamed protein product [Miscanthus lutarioriparius]|uniref:F-box domain-containing protein n=1 Tax=Miscanthus lutarioriparius TaxID=422564 RepID=A0A811Q6B4_9POAL|nr:unnamed protein product [Miscanthus lutarioriparius]
MWLARGSEHLLLARAAVGNEDVSTSTPRLLATEIGPVQGAGEQGASGVCEDEEAQGGEDAEGHKPEENRECEEGWVEESGDPRDVAAKRRRRAAAESSVRGGEMITDQTFTLDRIVDCILGMDCNNDDLDKQNEATETQIFIPQDAQGIILAFLPGRDVVKSRSVCKFWRDCVEEPSFVDRHLNNACRFHQSIACFTSLDHGLVHMYTFDPATMNFRSVELVFSREGKLRLLSTHSDGSNNIVSDIWVADLTSQDWIHLQTIVPRMPVGISPFFQLKTKIFFGNQKRLLCVDLQDGTVSYINMPPGETLISCGMFVESFAPAVTGMVSSTAASYGIRSCLAEPSSADPGPSFRGAGSSSASHGRSSGLTGWSSADLEQSFKRTKRTTNMQWKISKHRAS